MSYEIVKKIRITSDKVYITCASNNVYPRYYDEHESSYLTNILVNEGIEALELYLLKAYEEGNFHKGVANKYSTAIERLQMLPIYEKYNWRKRDSKNSDCQIEKNRNSEKFNRLLLDSLKLKPIKFKAYIVKPSFDKKGYVNKVTSKYISWTTDIKQAKVFNDKLKADNVLKYIP